MTNIYETLVKLNQDLELEQVSLKVTNKFQIHHGSLNCEKADIP